MEDDSSFPAQEHPSVISNAIGAGQGRNAARDAMIRAGIPKKIPAYVVNKVRGLGMGIYNDFSETIARP